MTDKYEPYVYETKAEVCAEIDTLRSFFKKGTEGFFIEKYNVFFNETKKGKQ